MNMDDFGGFIPLINIDRRMWFEKYSYSIVAKLLPYIQYRNHFPCPWPFKCSLGVVKNDWQI
jgi:hypothetical protein